MKIRDHRGKLRLKYFIKSIPEWTKAGTWRYVEQHFEPENFPEIPERSAKVPASVWKFESGERSAAEIRTTPCLAAPRSERWTSLSTPTTTMTVRTLVTVSMPSLSLFRSQQRVQLRWHWQCLDVGGSLLVQVQVDPGLSLTSVSSCFRFRAILLRTGFRFSFLYGFNFSKENTLGQIFSFWSSSDKMTFQNSIVGKKKLSNHLR